MERTTARIDLFRFLRFALVGAAGFVVDAGILLALMQGAGWHPLLARGVSLLCAIGTTWLLNRHFTFRISRPFRHREWLAYFLCMGMGAAANYGIYALGMALLPIPVLPWRALAALVVATLAAMLLNYNAMRLWVFRET